MTDKGTPIVETTKYSYRAPGQAPDTVVTQTPDRSTVNVAPASSNWGMVIGTVAVVAVVALGAWAVLGRDANPPVPAPGAPALTAPAAEPAIPAPEAATPLPEAIIPAPQTGTTTPEVQPVVPEPTAPATTGN